MSNWYYFNENDEKVGPISATVLKELARQGLITKETKIVNGNGRSALAGQVNGLTFSETKKPDPLPSFESPGFDFPALTSESQTPDDFDPFANAASATPEALPSQEIPLASVKSIATTSIGCIFMLFILFCVFNGFHSAVKEKPRKAPKDFALSLKIPPGDKYDLWLSLKGKKIKGKADIVLDELAAVEIADGCTNAAKHVYEIGNVFKDEENLLQKMERLQDCYGFCMNSIRKTLWHADEKKKTYPKLNITFRVLALGYEESGCFHNLEQMMTSIRLSVDKLDSVKYENTHKLFDVLLQYEKAVTKPENFVTLEGASEGTLTGHAGLQPHFFYNMTGNRLQKKFDNAMNLVKSEW